MMTTARRLGLLGTATTLGAVLALAVVVMTSNVPVHANSAPDLEVGTPTVDDSSPFTGASFTLSATVTNAGDGESTATTLRYYRSTDTTITTSDTQLGTDSVGALAAAGTSDQTIDLTAPSTTGTYYYGACVDSVTGESDTTDNCSSAVTVTVKARPDLDVDGMELAMKLETPRVGGEFSIQAHLRNTGGSESGATTVRIYRSTDTTITTSDTEVATAAVTSLEAGARPKQWVNITAPSTVGTYYYGACVDSVTGESDTSDNCFLGWFEVPVPLPRPDLAVQSPSVDDATLATGATFTLSATVANSGDWQSNGTTLRYYRSTDATITTADTEVGTDEVDGLLYPPHGGQWAQSSESIDLTAPSTVGTYYYGACVDSVTGESDTTNNCSSSVTVTVQVNSAATGAPTISGTAQVGQTLTASTTGISDSDGLTNVSYSYQWLADDTEIDGATSSTYTVQASDNGKVIKVQVTFTDDAGNDESLTSAGTSAVVLGGL